MQDVSQRLDPRTHPVRRRPVLSRGDIRMLPPHFPAALPAGPRFHRVTPYFRLRLHRDIGGGNDFRDRFAQRASAVGTARRRHRYQRRFGYTSHGIGPAKPEQSLSGLASRRLRVRLVRSFGKRRRRASSLQLLNLGPQLPDRLMLLDNDLCQSLAAQ